MFGRELLCQRCEDDGWKTCFFAKVAQLIAEDPYLAPVEKYLKITRQRIGAINIRACPHAHTTDPYYPGQEKL